MIILEVRCVILGPCNTEYHRGAVSYWDCVILGILEVLESYCVILGPCNTEYHRGAVSYWELVFD